MHSVVVSGVDVASGGGVGSGNSNANGSQYARVGA